MLTFTLGGFIVSTYAIVASTLEEFAIGGFELTFRTPDATMVSALLGATLLAYVNRRNKKLDAEVEMKKLKIQSGIIE